MVDNATHHDQDPDLKHMPDGYWREKLTPEQFRVLREKGTEHAFSGLLYSNEGNGYYACAGCGAPIFSSEKKFNSGTGWPSFTDVIDKRAVEFHEDKSMGMLRTEVTCAACGGHLGHVFSDGPDEQGGKRYCINSCALDFTQKE
jgi:peptide-methionine (R)-S-oxide reductase